MIPLRVDAIARATGGRLTGGARSDDVVDGAVVVDSRLVERGGLFVCVRGETHDGYDFAAAAIASGASLVLADHELDVPALVVDDTTAALGAVAREVVRRLPDVVVVGVTGSNGKTSTKDLLADIFAQAGPSVSAQGSLNNELGLPLTVCRADDRTRSLVLEYAARGQGHIRYLTSIAPPTIAIVLNVGVAHIGEFGSRDGIARAKGELVEAVPANGTAILNADDPYVAAMRGRTNAGVLTFGTSHDADFVVRDLVTDDLARPSFVLDTPDGSVEVVLRLHGAHHAINAAAVVAAAFAAGIAPATAVATATAAGAHSAHRMDVRRRADGLVVVDDAYNASPDSMVAALHALATIGADRRRWAVFGPMRELGDVTEEAHREVGTVAAELGTDRVVVVGEDARAIGVGSRAVAGWNGTIDEVDDIDAAIALLLDSVGANDAVLVKASNAARLWRIADALDARSVTEVRT